jgi:UDP-glucose 4-epimerase
MKILVTGGLGYIGSHCVKQLLKKGDQVVIIDNLVTSIVRHASLEVPTYHLNLNQTDAVQTVLEKENIDLVMHFAASSCVRQAMQAPLSYYQNNVAASLSLFQAMAKANVKHIVFSSTCAIYGQQDGKAVTEQTLPNPLNPYGHSKLFVEQVLRDLVHLQGWHAAIFRYFNATGASPDGDLAELHVNETRLIPLAIQTLLGKRQELEIYGTDYNTPDGTCIRDYVHVDDICRAHLQVIPRLQSAGGLHIYNLGLGRPYSVKEIIVTLEKIAGKQLPIKYGHRKNGEAAALYADCTKASQDLGWKPIHATLPEILETSWKAACNFV